MSVLSFPRIYFSGFMAWDPPTANNNDYMPVYDGPNAALDWNYLSTQGITPDNFQAEFRNWMMKSHSDTCPPSPPNPATNDTCTDCGTPSGEDVCNMGSRWDYYGSGGCWLVNYPEGQKVTQTTGGALAYNQSPPANDAILGQPVVIIGNTFGGRPSPARLIDVNPESPWSSQIFFGSIRVGDQQTFISGPQYLRMHSRRFFVPRNLSSDLIIAGAIGVIFQTTIPFDQLTIGNSGNSQLLSTLSTAMQQPGAQGLMWRFSAYNTLYYQNGIFNNIQQQPRTCDELEAMYASGEVFMNPAYSNIVGTFGVWNDGELSTVPGGHFIVPNQAVQLPPAAPVAKVGALKSVPGHGSILFEQLAPTAPADPPPPPPSFAFGPVMAEIDSANSLVSLDLSNAILESDAQGDKYNYGPITVGVQSTGGSFQPIGSFTDYDLVGYQATSGLVDVPFQTGVTWDMIQPLLQAGGLLALQVQQNGSAVTASLENPLTAETDQRGIYLDQCQTIEFTVQVRYQNGAPPAGTQILLAQYYPWTLNVGAGQWQLFGATPPSGGSSSFCNATPAQPYVKFLDGDTIPVTVPTINGSPAPYGEATVRLGHQTPGFPVVAFYPFLSGQATPSPQTQVTFSFAGYSTYTIGNAYYCAVRTMPADNSLVQQFVDCWNAAGSYTGQPQYSRVAAWNFIYQNILYVYDMLYPVMDQFMPLGNLERVEGAIDQLMTMISDEWMNGSTLYMPITRELSAGKRLILEAWGNLVASKYPQQPLQPIPVPCDTY